MLVSTGSDNLLYDLSSDVVSIAKTGENFRLLYDSKGRFTLHSISLEEAKVQILYLNMFIHGCSPWFSMLYCM